MIMVNSCVEENPHKRAKALHDIQHEDEESTAKDPLPPPPQTRANEVIEIIFGTNDGQNVARVAPDFTHQLFQDEIIIGIEATEKPLISVHVDMTDLDHSIYFSETLSSHDQDRLLSCLSPALPTAATTTRLCSKEPKPPKSYQPPGQLIHRFKSSDDDYEIWLATAKDPGAMDLLQRGECLARWFIETADSVEFDEERWEVLFLFQRQRQQQKDQLEEQEQDSGSVMFAGYMTLFTFRNPFLGSKVRICQALILPHLQGRGLGVEVMLCMYRMVGSRDSVREVTVEDPCAGFQRLRDKADYTWYQQHFPTQQPLELEGETKGKGKERPARTDEEVAEKLRLTKPQAAFVLEVEQYKYITSNSDGSTDVARLKQFRLQVKRQLLREDKELKDLPKQALQRELDGLFEDRVSRYVSVLHKRK